MILSQVGAALVCIGVARFEGGDACATPKVYKSPRLFKSYSRKIVRLFEVVDLMLGQQLT